MSDKIYIGKNAQSVTVGERLSSYSKVVINIDEEHYVEAGNDAALTLEISCPWGTQEMANAILTDIAGFQYQPFDAISAILSPATELGDGITVGGVYSGVFKMDTHFSSLCTADVYAPYDEEIDHEYPYQSSTQREITRQIAQTKASLAIQADNIEAKVSKEGGVSTSFSWTLTEDGFVLSSNGSEVFRADSNGIAVKGRIEATSGFIGSGTDGFNITSRAIYKGTTSMGDEVNNGVYIGTDGISLGGGKFKVDAQGNLTASSGTFTGNVNAANIKFGGAAGYISGGAISAGSIGVGGGSALSGGVLDSLVNANSAFSMLNGQRYTPLILAQDIRLLYSGSYRKLRLDRILDKNGTWRNVVSW